MFHFKHLSHWKYSSVFSDPFFTNFFFLSFFFSFFIGFVLHFFSFSFSYFIYSCLLLMYSNNSTISSSVFHVLSFLSSNSTVFFASINLGSSLKFSSLDNLNIIAWGSMRTADFRHWQTFTFSFETHLMVAKLTASATFKPKLNPQWYAPPNATINYPFWCKALVILREGNYFFSR